MHFNWKGSYTQLGAVCVSIALAIVILLCFGSLTGSHNWFTQEVRSMQFESGATLITPLHFEGGLMAWCLDGEIPTRFLFKAVRGTYGCPDVGYLAIRDDYFERVRASCEHNLFPSFWAVVVCAWATPLLSLLALIYICLAAMAHRRNATPWLCCAVCILTVAASAAAVVVVVYPSLLWTPCTVPFTIFARERYVVVDTVTAARAVDPTAHALATRALPPQPSAQHFRERRRVLDGIGGGWDDHAARTAVVGSTPTYTAVHPSSATRVAGDGDAPTPFPSTAVPPPPTPDRSPGLSQAADSVPSPSPSLPAPLAPPPSVPSSFAVHSSMYLCVGSDGRSDDIVRGCTLRGGYWCYVGALVLLIGVWGLCCGGICVGVGVRLWCLPVVEATLEDVGRAAAYAAIAPLLTKCRGRRSVGAACALRVAEGRGTARRWGVAFAEEEQLLTEERSGGRVEGCVEVEDVVALGSASINEFVDAQGR